MKTYKISQIAAFGALIVIIAGLKPASADTFKFVTGNFHATNVKISTNSGSSYFSTEAGEYKATIGTGRNTKTIGLYCVDLDHGISAGDTFAANLTYHLTDAAGSTYTTGGNKYYKGGLTSALGNDIKAYNYNSHQPASSTNLSFSNRASEVAWLADNFQNIKTFSSASGTNNYNKNQTAVGLAIWDIIRDGGNGLGQGTVVGSTSTKTDFSSLVNYYEGLAAAHSSYTSNTAFFVQSPLSHSGHYQDFVYSTATPTPEAGTSVALALMCVGGMFFRRKKSAVRTA